MGRSGTARRFRRRGEHGETLAEVVVAIAILGFAVVTIVASMAAAINLSNRHREQATAGVVLGNAAESIKNDAVNPYSCPASGPPTYDPALGNSFPSGYTVTVTAIQYWNGTSFVSGSGCPNPDLELQKVTVQVVSPRGYTTSVDVVKRNPA